MGGDLPSPSVSDGSAVAISKDSRTLFSIDRDETLILWDLPSQTRLGEPMVIDGAASLAFSPESNALVTVGDQPGLVWLDPVLWSEDIEVLKRRLCPIVGRELTATEWEKFLPGEPHHPTCASEPGS